MPAVADKLTGGARFTNKVVELVCVIVPLVPVIVSERAYGLALVVVFMVSVEAPEVLIEAGLKPPLVIPVGKPDSLPTLRLTVPLNPVRDVTVTVKEADCPGTTATDVGLTAMEKFAVVGSTVIVRVDGLGSELPLLSITVSDTT